MRRRLLPALAALALLPAQAHAVVGGQSVPPGKYPFVAYIDISGQASCTGDLIAPTWVLTAGHCAAVTGAFGVPLGATLPPSAYTVTLGTVNADHSGGQTFSVRSVQADPDYFVANGTGHDVSLLELERPASILPIQIASTVDRSRWAAPDLLTIAGFGLTQEGGSPPPTMQEAQVPRVADTDCSNAYSNTEPVAGDAFDPETALCAGYPQGGVDTCEGDSGGPLMVVFGYGARLVGATSYGEGCARPGKPGVYAKLTSGPVKAFIRSIVPTAFAPTSLSCFGTPGMALRVNAHRRVTLSIDGKRIWRRRGPLTVHYEKRLPRYGIARVRIAVRGLRTIHATYTNCQRSYAR
jgi:secreted trypsin-like serine protease